MKKSNMDSRLVILVAHHKPGFVIKDDVYLPIQVGAENAKVKLDMQGDNTGDNISELNPVYCEMTAVYWAWKNLVDKPDYIGLCHYRRYFTNSSNGFLKNAVNYFNFLKCRFIGRFTHPEVDNVFSKQFRTQEEDVICRKAKSFEEEIITKLEDKSIGMVIPTRHNHSAYSLYGYFSQLAGRYVVDSLEHIIEMEYPLLYPYFMASIKKNWMYAANMVILKRDIFNDYCQTIFSILEKHRHYLEDSGWVSSTTGESVFSRVSGYMAELLTNAYVQMQIGLGTKYVKVNTVMCK